RSYLSSFHILTACASSRLSVDCSRFHARFEPPGEHQAQHSEIADQRPPWMPEGCGLVALDHEVSDPGKSIGHHRPEQRIPWMANGKSHNQRNQSQQSACGVHGAIARVAMLMQIEGEEILVASKF